MDRLLYIAMNGARHAQNQQATVANNLANINTAGYRAQQDNFRALWVFGEGMPTRTFAVDATVGNDFSPAAFQQTERPLDLAIQSKGWFAVQSPAGEAYTRDGSFTTDVEGMLVTRQGFPVLTTAGPVVIPSGQQPVVGRDGTLSVIDPNTPVGTGNAPAVVLGQLKLVNPEESSLLRGGDGFFRGADGVEADADPNVSVVSGMLEGSNVSAAESLVRMITASRLFGMQLRMIESARQNAQAASQILNPSS